MIRPLEAGASALGLKERVTRFYDLDEQMLRDPWPMYAEMRETQPVMRVGSAVVVTRYDDIKSVISDATNFSNKRYTGSRVTQKRAALAPDEVAHYNYLIELDVNHIGQNDPPNHTRLRRFVNQAFSARAVGRMREQVAETAHSFLDEVDAGGDQPFDLAALSWRLPFAVVCSMLHVPDVEVSTFRGWALAIRRGLGTNYDNLDEAYHATRNLEDYVLELIQERRVKAGEDADDDLVSNLLATDVEGTHLTDREMVTMFAVMLTSGNANDMISNAVIALDQWPDQKALLREHPDHMRNAVEEFLRYCPSVHGVHRVALDDCEIAGFPVHAGETVRLVVGSANHDPARFDDPERLDITRTNARQHLDFGYGIHTCVGQWLARMDIEVSLSVLYERYPDLRVAAPFRYRREYQFRGPEQLLVSRS